MTRYVKIFLAWILILGIGTSSCIQATRLITIEEQFYRTTPTDALPDRSSFPSTECWPVFQNTKSIKGSFVYQDRAKKSAFSWDLSTLHTTPIIGFTETIERSFPSPVSLDGGTLFGLSDNNKIFIMSQHQIQSFQLPAGDYGSIRSLSDGRIRIPIAEITRESPDDSHQQKVGLRDEFYILDPVSGNITLHSVFLPNFLIGPHELRSIQYSPDMHYVVYLTGYDHYSPRFTLLDLHQNKVVWSGPDIPEGMHSDAARMPVWRPDSGTLVYSFITEKEKYGNYYLISLDGKLSQLTQFKRTEMMGLSTGPIANPSWSPDGRYLAFKAAQGSNGPIRLYMWDTQKKVALMPCLPDEEKIDIGYIGHWSYDGAYFLITLGYPNKENPEEGPNYVRYKTVILDMAGKTIFELPDEDHRGEYTSIYGNNQKHLLGWVNWETP